VYGNTIRDLDAASRSLETQIPVEGPLNTATLTGQTDFDQVRITLDRLQTPEAAFEDRIHVVTASSMMSHGVDIDRLNLMVMLGLPLTTAEYIQTTARVGRRWPGAVFVLHKMARERDASTYRAWAQFVRHGDRLVEPVPITHRSRRVLERTAPGLLLGRLLHVHETSWNKRLTTAKALREYAREGRFGLDAEFAAITEMLALDDPLDEPVREALRRWLDGYFENLDDDGYEARFPSDLCPGGESAMRSLRDVEAQAPVRDIVIGEGRR
jgi:superfamily II DNA or RNA helicase